MNTFISGNNLFSLEDQHGLNGQAAEVKAWLMSQFSNAGKHVPKFEHTLQSISHLHNLLKLSEANTRAALIVTNDLRQKSAGYSSQAARIRELLESVGLGNDNLPQNVKASRNILASLANLLNLKDTETDVEEKRIRSQRESHILLDRTRKAITRMAKFRRIFQQLEDGMVTCEDQMKTWEQNLEIMTAKEKQYIQQHANFKEVLDRAGYTPDISHQVLIDMAVHKYELEEETIPIVDTLRNYRDLPPDKTLASLAVQDKTREYEAAEQYLEDLLLLALDTED